MKAKRIVSLFLALVLILSCSITAFANGYFYKDFGTIEESRSFFEKYSADFPNVEYSENGIHASSKYFALKNKEFLEVYINDPAYTLTNVHCSEVVYERGIDTISFDYEHSNGRYRVDVSINYDLPEDWVLGNLERIEEIYAPFTYSGEIMGYPYVAGETCDEFGCDEECFYEIAVGDVLVNIRTNFFYDKKLLENVVIENVGFMYPVYEQVEQKPIEVSDELLYAARADYHNDDLEKSNIRISDLDVISDTKQFVRFTVSPYGYTCDVVYQYIGEYGFCTPQRPLPQVLVDGVLYELKDAYEKGVITDDDLAEMAEFESRNFYFVHKDELRGDVSGDMNVDVYDATTIQKCLAGRDDFSWHRGKEYADFDGDGVVSILDATGIQMKVAKIK